MTNKTTMRKDLGDKLIREKLNGKSGKKTGKTGGKMSDMGIDGRVKVNDRHVHTKKPEHCEKALCCHNCSGKL